MSAKLRVLLADDHPIVRAGLRGLLEARGIEVVGEASNGQQAIEAALETEPDVALMDLSMPIVDGFESTKKIVAGSPRTRVLVLTTYASEADAVRAVDAGATGYLLKDAAADEIVLGVRNVAAGAPAFTPAVAAAVMRRLLIGAAGVSRGDDESSATWVIEPDVGVDVRLLEWMRIGVAAGYRFVGGSDDAKLTFAQLSGPAAGITVKLGAF